MWIHDSFVLSEIIVQYILVYQIRIWLYPNVKAKCERCWLLINSEVTAVSLPADLICILNILKCILKSFSIY